MRALGSICLLVIALVHPVLGQSAREPWPTADAMRGQLAKRPERDGIHWKDPARGKAVQVRIVEMDDKAVRVQKTLPTGIVDRRIPWADLSGVTFALTPLERRLLDETSAEAVPALRVLWDARKAALRIEGSGVGEIGLALAMALRMSREPQALDEAQALLNHLSATEVTEHKKQAVKDQLRLLEMTRALVLGPPEETDRVAWMVTGEGGNAEVMLLATAWLADRHFADLKRLEEEHPRWEEDEEVRPLRMRLYHLSLDFALYPGLFHGSQREASAHGLKKAWEVHRHTGNNVLALQTLEDLAALYPDTQAAKETANELVGARARVASATEQKSSQEPAESAETSDEQVLPKIPPPPKRYNLFDD